MNQSILITVNPTELVQLIKEGIKDHLQEISSCIITNPSNNEKPHLTRRETAKFFDISLNCLNDWCKKGILTPFKVGQRVYFKREECINVMFNQNH